MIAGYLWDFGSHIVHTVGINAFLVASGRSITTTSSLLPPLPELFVL